MKLSQVIEELTQERGLAKPVLTTIIAEGMLAAYKKRYPEYALQVEYNKKSDEIEIKTEKEVVSQVADETKEISLRKAKSFLDTAAVGDKILVPFDQPIGRIEILKAKQIIAQKIRAIEATAVYEEFKPREGAVIQGVVHKMERNGATVMIQDTLAFLPKSLMIPGEKIIVGYPIRALLKEVLPEPRNENQLILDRTSADFLKKLFELEIPEIFEKLVEVKKVVRSAGYKAKVLVASNDKDIDPIGTCVGKGGSRIEPIRKELNGEKIDIISPARTSEDLVKAALKPAVINRVEMTDSQNASVWLDDDQRSLAIGKGGQNIELASQLTGINIHLVKLEADSQNKHIEDQEVEETSSAYEDEVV